MTLSDNKNSKIKVVVGMSGGIDSSLAAALLKKDGYDVIGMTFKMWPKEECGQGSAGRACCSLESVARARAVALDLGIPYYVVDFSSEFKKEVIDYFCGEYLKGSTPNPCVICNSSIKFGSLLDKARSLGASYVATGHYARLGFNKASGRYLLKSGKDKLKDQSYFLFNLSQNQLKHALFPLGGLTKDKARLIAKCMKIRTYNTASSQDICFVRDLSYVDYIKKKTGIEIRPGDIVNRAGRVIGRHKGIPFYTIGQRRGLGIAHTEPLYVSAIDIGNNRIIVGERDDIMKNGLIADRVNWIAIGGISRARNVMVKIRYNHAKAPARVIPESAGAIRIEFDEPQSAPTPGQAAVLYDRDKVIGGGWIKEAI